MNFFSISLLLQFVLFFFIGLVECQTKYLLNSEMNEIQECKNIFIAVWKGFDKFKTENGTLDPFEQMPILMDFFGRYMTSDIAFKETFPDGTTFTANGITELSALAAFTNNRGEFHIFGFPLIYRIFEDDDKVYVAESRDDDYVRHPLADNLTSCHKYESLKKWECIIRKCDCSDDQCTKLKAGRRQPVLYISKLEILVQNDYEDVTDSCSNWSDEVRGYAPYRMTDPCQSNQVSRFYSNSLSETMRNYEDKYLGNHYMF